MNRPELKALLLRLWAVTPAEHGAIAEDVQDALFRLLKERDEWKDRWEAADQALSATIKDYEHERQRSY